jgi:hypothetical protein
MSPRFTELGRAKVKGPVKKGAMEYKQKRKAERRSVTWTSRIQWEQGEERVLETAKVKVFSMAGLYFEFAGDIEPGAGIECLIDMPPEMAFGKGVVMRCRGEVVTVRPVEGEALARGVGMRTDHYSFTEAENERDKESF